MLALLVRGVLVRIVSPYRRPHRRDSRQADFACSAVKFWTSFSGQVLWRTRAAAENLREVFYFFRRNGVSIRCEVRSDSAGQGYELVVARPDAMIRVERFDAPPDLNRRWREIERALIREGWNGPRVREM